MFGHTSELSNYFSLSKNEEWIDFHLFKIFMKSMFLQPMSEDFSQIQKKSESIVSVAFLVLDHVIRSYMHNLTTDSALPFLSTGYLWVFLELSGIPFMLPYLAQGF